MGKGFILDALEVGIYAYNKSQAADLKKEDCTFGEPVDLLVLSGGVAHPTKKNTAVACKHVPTGKEFTLYYNRYSITTYQGNFPPNSMRIFLLNNADGDLKKLANSITRFQGLPMLERDLVSGAFDPVAKGATTVQYTLTIAPTSYNYIPGETFKVAIAGRYYRLNDKVCLVQDVALKPDVWYEDRLNQGAAFASTIAMGQIATYGKDYTPARTYLRRLNGYPTYAAGARLNASVSLGTWYERFCKALTAVDGMPWTYGSTAAAAWNLHYVWVVYNGPVEGARNLNAQQYRVPTQYLPILQAANPEFDNVCIFYTELTANLGRSCLLLHYNNG